MANTSSIKRWLFEPEPPGLGLELRSGEMALARLNERRGGMEVNLCTTAPLPAGVLNFQMLEPNIKDMAEFARNLEGLLQRAEVQGKRIALTVPDNLARVSLQQLPEAPRSRDELRELLRFRLKKTLPFDVEQARLAFSRQGDEPPTFLTGVMHEAIISQYEEILEEMGFQVGVVLPASLSLLNLWRPWAARELAPGADYFFVNVEREYFTVTLVRDREAVVLMRTLGLRASDDPAGAYQADDLVREIIPTVFYYRDKLKGTSLDRVYYRSLRPDIASLEDLLQEQFEVPAVPFELTNVVSVGKGVNLDPALADAIGPAAGVAFGEAA